MELPVTDPVDPIDSPAPGTTPTGAAAPGSPAPESPAPAPQSQARRGPIHTTAEIQALIPHRWPFLLVDRIVEYEPDQRRIVGLKALTATEWFFQGHFPGLPVMPGVLQVEALAQTMAVYVAKQPGFGDRIGLFAAIDDCRFKRVVAPGDTLRLEVTMDKLGSRFGRGRGVASVEGETACEATISFIIPGQGVLR
ncbi:MAG TPA: 3-hydroxyacyl-ACP dehydratase FabZ [Candidatus Limnocylindrales bacterium]